MHAFLRNLPLRIADSPSKHRESVCLAAEEGGLNIPKAQDIKVNDLELYAPIFRFVECCRGRNKEFAGASPAELSGSTRQEKNITIHEEKDHIPAACTQQINLAPSAEES